MNGRVLVAYATWLGLDPRLWPRPIGPGAAGSWG